jgi:ribosome recycling factor
MSEGKQLRINVPPLSGERRQQLVAKCKKLAEEAKVVLRNARRDGNKHADNLKAGGHIAEDEINTLKEEVQGLLKKYETDVDKTVEAKTKEITEV